MRSVSIRLSDLEGGNKLIPIGFQGENEYTTVNIDCKKIFDQHPTAVPALAVTPPQGDSYPAIVVRDGDIVSWTVCDSDLVYEGNGEFQLTFVIDETVIGKTYKARTKVLGSIEPSGETPTPIQNWLIQAAAALQALPQEVSNAVVALMGAMVGVGETLDPGENVTVSYDVENNALTIGVPRGADGHSPVVTASKSGGVTTLYVDDVPIATINDGITDVRMLGVWYGGKSLVENGVATIPNASQNEFGLVRVDPVLGITIGASNNLEIVEATSSTIKKGSAYYRPISPVRQHEAVFYGLAKAAGDTSQKASENPVGTYTETAKTKIKEMLDVPSPTSIIDDNAGEGDTDNVWSADKSASENLSLKTEINSKQDAPSATGTAGQVLGLDSNLAPLWKDANDYVTPEMFGAKGDGTTDDTNALQAMFNTGKNVHFPNKSYATTGVSITSIVNVEFTDTTFIALTAYQDYVLNISARVSFTGKLYIDGKYKTLVGVKFATGSNDSSIEYLKINFCKAWGIYITTGHISFEYIYTMECGTRIQLNVSRESNYRLLISGSITENNKTLLKSDYINGSFMLVDSGYTTTEYPGPFMRKVAGFDEENDVLLLTEDSINRILSSSNFENVSISVCYGGGIDVASGVNSQINFGVIDTRLGSTGISFHATYGHYIGSMYSQSDRIPIAICSLSLGNFIGSITTEGSKSGYTILSYYYDYSVIVTRSTGYDDNFLSSQICSQSLNSRQSGNALLLKSLRRVAVPRWYLSGEVYTINEMSPDITLFTNKNTFNIGVRDLYSGSNSFNYWGVKTVYFTPLVAQNDNIVINLNNDAKSNGYAISGGVNGTLTFARPSPTAWFKIQIFLYDKVFYVTIEEITKVTPIT